PIRVLLGKLGLDGHDRGVKVVARGLRDAGMEVIYLGMRLTARQMVEAAQQEDVDVIGISLLSGAHMRLMTQFMEAVRNAQLDDVLVVVGVTIPDADVPRLQALGVNRVFQMGEPIEEIARYLREQVEQRRQKAG